MANSTVLAVDVGNTRAKFGLFEVTSGQFPRPLHVVGRRIQEREEPGEVLGTWLSATNGETPTTALVAGSDPETRDRLLSAWPLPEIPPVTIASWQQIPVTVDVDAPEKVGIDRLLNAHAGRLLQGRHPAACILVDSGTATTVDLMTSDGVFRGGSILPGLRLSAIALHEYTARLPLIDVDEERAALPEVPGRNTLAAMEAGLFVGQLGAVRELAGRLSTAAMQRFGETGPPVMLITGGGGRQLMSELEGARYIDSLALHGLASLAGE